MISKKSFLAALAVAASIVVCTQAGSVNIKSGLYKANWAVANQNIMVVITASTSGYIGFGINKFPNMTGADLFIGGVFNNGSTYGYDMHGIGNRAPVLDKVQNYELLSASESNIDSKTTITFRRLLATEDIEEDNDITNSEQFLLWSVGETDNLQHHAARGSVKLNLLA